MKKTILVLLAFLIAAGLFWLGWHFGQNSASTLIGEFTDAQMFGNANGQVLDDELILEQIDAGHIDEAKNAIYLRMDGNILELNSELTTTNTDFPIAALRVLIQMQNDTTSKYGSKGHIANTTLTRVAKYRVEHPWKYSGAMPTSVPEVQAKVDDILKQAN